MTDAAPRNVAGYVRVSSARQVREGESLAEQAAQLRAACVARGWPRPRIYKEMGVSAAAARRPALTRLLRHVRAGDVDLVLVKKVDRLSRSLVDFERTHAILEKHRVDLVSLQESFDSTTAVGRAVLRVVLTFAQLEREQVSERTRDVMAHLARQGRYTGRYVPWGYDLLDGKLAINEEEARLVRMAFATYLEVGSLSGTAAVLNAKGARTKARTAASGRAIGGKLFTKTILHRVFHDRVYVGEVKHRGEWFPGEHEALVDVGVFEGVGERLAAKNPAARARASQGAGVLLPPASRPDL